MMLQINSRRLRGITFIEATAVPSAVSGSLSASSEASSASIAGHFIVLGSMGAVSGASSASISGHLVVSGSVGAVSGPASASISGALLAIQGILGAVSGPAQSRLLGEIISQTNNALDGVKPFGFHFNSITAQGVTIEFAPHRLASVRTLFDPMGVRTPAEWPGEILVDDGTTFPDQDVLLKSKLSDGTDYFDLDLDCEAIQEQGFGRLRITPKISMRSNWAPDYCFHSMSVSIRIKPPGNGDPSKCRVLVPNSSASGEVVPWQEDSIFPIETGSPSLSRRAHPGVAPKGGEFEFYTNPAGDIGVVQADEPSGELIAASSSGSQFMLFYDDETKEGLLVRTDDIEGQYKLFVYSRDLTTQDIILEVFFVPPSNSTGIDNESDYDFPWSLHLMPMVGDWNHAIAADKALKEAEGHPAFDVPEILENNEFPWRAKSALCFAPNFGAGSYSPFDFSGKYLEQWDRIRDRFAGGPFEILGIWYETGPQIIGTTAPLHTPLRDNCLTAMEQALQKKHSVLAYTIPLNPVRSVIDAIVPRLNIIDNMVRTRLGYVMADQPDLDASDTPIEIEHPLVGAADGGEAYLSPDFSNDTNNRQYATFIVAQFGRDVVGFYVDTAIIFGSPDNSNPALPAEERGIGAESYIQRQMGMIAQMGELSAISQPVLMGEWPSEFVVGKIHLVNIRSIGSIGSTSSQVNVFQKQFGSRCLTSTFYPFGRGPSDELLLEVPGVASRLEVLNAYHLYWACCGHLLPIAAFFDQRPDEFFVGLEESWYAESQGHYDFIYDCWWARRSLTKRFFQSQMMFDSPSTSIFRRKVDERCGAISSQSVYLYSQGFYEPRWDACAWFCGNWTMVGEQSNGGLGITEAWNETFLLSDFPEMGSSPRNVWIVDRAGSYVAMPPYDGLGSYSINYSMAPSETVWLVLGDIPDTFRGGIDLRGSYSTSESLGGSRVLGVDLSGDRIVGSTLRGQVAL